MGRVTPDRFRECLQLLDWSQRGVAALLDINERQVRRFATGQYRIPDPIAEWLETLARFHEAHPAPMPATPAPK
jgi:ribosome-binding protein aMBF1 (putative translation factor)